ncbi:peptidoglycan DD-metalloendopeptidase family protein [uncultured Maricaulis sp.]|uniref:M23 family metallopeptidase n=1 Tax=uncultured Maricaulis sp. TaxID=174710 RepID=UPI0030DA02C1|tara:strand:- start:20719 stop:22206 length:1488 start_codon:yes stop_codon:yes gene_type:complete
MPEFDVTHADQRRARGLVVCASLLLSAGLLAALMTSKDTRSEAAGLTAPAAAVALVDINAAALDASGSASTLALRTETADPDLPHNPAWLDTNAFTACNDCPTHIQLERIVPPGGTLAGILDDAGVDSTDAVRAIRTLNQVYDLRYLRAGQSLNLYLESEPVDNGEAADDETQSRLRLTGISFRPEVERSITVARTWRDEYRARETIAEFERQVVRSSGTITSSLYVDALNAGATDRIVVDLANVLAYAIDFQRSIQPGDGFDILFERFVDEEGHTARTGDILYARYEGRAAPKEFFRFETSDGGIGYYSAEGASAQRLLMLTPINGARLSSSFGQRRHPILGYTRAHNGTDFAAPRGTPVFASGNGVVERANRFGSFGNYVKIRHANGFETAYAHLNGFARGIRAGSRVTQGQVIAYVGTTGRSTGPHLHYEVHVNGRPVNPMTLDLPTGRQLTTADMPAFIAERDRIITIRDGAQPANASDTPLMADAGSSAH